MKKKINSWWFLLRFYLYTLAVMIPKVAYFERLTKKGEIEKRNKKAFEVIQKWADYTVKIGGSDVKVYGIEKIPTDRPVLFIANHESYGDVPMLIYALRDFNFGFMMKSTMGKIPFIKNYLEYMGSVMVNQSDMRQALSAINEAADVINQGHSIVIFPEGKRSFSNTPATFKNGAFKVVRKTCVTVVPIYLHNVHLTYEANERCVCGADVTVTVLDPIETKDMSRADVQMLNETVYNVISDYAKNFDNISHK
ncbi:MAG: 1-acyl-sn-glycerol-3-phosphate acyltransferase [Oscillospiraceae bacterium]|nr:1-acyl-sn-glycerol-3-phosphate acyltransferase [Oscillospiraceae bacterium]